MLSKILSNMSVCMYYLLDLAQQGPKRRRKWGEGPANCISCFLEQPTLVWLFSPFFGLSARWPNSSIWPMKPRPHEAMRCWGNCCFFIFYRKIEGAIHWAPSMLRGPSSGRLIRRLRSLKAPIRVNVCEDERNRVMDWSSSSLVCRLKVPGNTMWVIKRLTHIPQKIAKLC